MSFENLSEVLWSTPGGRGIFGLFGHHDTNGTMSSSMHSYGGASNIFGDNQGGGGENGTTPHNFVVGISIAVATSFIQSLGLTIQRKSHVLNEAIHPKELRRQACQRPLWHLGFHTYILSNLTGTIFSIGYLPVIILAPLGAVTLVFNALFARLLLGDQFSRQSAAGTFLILLGAIMIGLFGIVPEPSHSLEDLIQLWKRPAFIIYFSLTEFTVVSLLVGNKIVERQLKEDAVANLAANHHRRHLRSGSAAGSVNPNMSIDSTPHYHKFVGGRLLGKLSPTKIKTLLGISYGCVGGMLSSQALLFAKSAIELLMLTILESKNQFENPLSWFLVIALITAALLQLYYLNKGLRLCDTVLLVPLSFCAYNVSCLFNGLVYYNQWGRLYWWQILLVLFGISQVLIGVLVLAWRPTSGDEYGEDVNNGDEATLLLPNASRPGTPRHSRVFSFKGVGGDGGVVGHMQQDPSIDARDLIQGFEMYDSDDDDLRGSNIQDQPLLQQQDQRLITLASEETATEEYPSPIQSPRSLTFAPANRVSK
ncbi:hypothetical protein EDD21DRAFT_364110 [Dissophora ornata]|nr:hypothetical protein BGZ58_008440 [Dissophora ornata]KAI8605238.1 hypothetical protein EDD21DRAFT_364110 [Dissophora ornata]